MLAELVLTVSRLLTKPCNVPAILAVFDDFGISSLELLQTGALDRLRELVGLHAPPIFLTILKCHLPSPGRLPNTVVPAAQTPEPCSIIVAFQRGRTTVLSARTLVALHLETFGECAQKLLLLLDHDVREQVGGRKIIVQTYSSGDFFASTHGLRRT